MRTVIHLHISTNTNTVIHSPNSTYRHNMLIYTYIRISTHIYTYLPTPTFTHRCTHTHPCRNLHKHIHTNISADSHSHTHPTCKSHTGDSFFPFRHTLFQLQCSLKSYFCAYSYIYESKFTLKSVYLCMSLYTPYTNMYRKTTSFCTVKNMLFSGHIKLLYPLKNIL